MFAFDSFVNEAVYHFKWSLDYAKEKGVRRFVIVIRPSSYCPLKVQGSGSRVGGQFFEVDFFDILAAVPSEFYDSRLSIRNACDIAVNKEVHADVAAEGDGVTGKEELGLIRNEEPSPDTI